MNKIKQEKKFESIPSAKKQHSSKPKIQNQSHLKSSFSATKHYTFDCEKCYQRAKRQIKLTATLSDKQKNLTKCLEFIDQLMNQNDVLRADEKNKQKTKEKRYKYKVDEIRVTKQSPNKQYEVLKKQLKSVKYQRDKLFDLVKQLEHENQQLLKTKDKSLMTNSRVITTFKQDPRLMSQQMKNSSLLSSNIKSQPSSAINPTELFKLKQSAPDTKLFQVITSLRQQKQYLNQKNQRLESMYKKSIRNYQQLLNKYEQQLTNNDKLRDQKQSIKLSLKGTSQQFQRLKKSRGDRATTESQYNNQPPFLIKQNQKLVNQLNQKQKQHNVIIMNLKNQIDSIMKQKQIVLSQKITFQKQALSLQSKINNNVFNHNKEVHELKQMIQQQQSQLKQLRQFGQRKDQEIEYLRISIENIHQGIQEKKKEIATQMSPRKQTWEKETQSGVITIEKGVQKNFEGLLNQQDLLTQIIQKDMMINTMQMENLKLQEIIVQLRGKRSRQNSDPNLSIATCKLENQKLIHSIYDRDIKINELQKQLRSLPSLEDTKDHSYEKQ